MPALLLLSLLTCISADQLRRAIKRQMPPVHQCYQQALINEAPGFAGRLVVRFVVGPKGTVNEVRVRESQLPSQKFETCVTNAVKAWRFPKPPGGGVIAIVYPFVFKGG